jgi:hypothetical protein
LSPSPTSRPCPPWWIFLLAVLVLFLILGFGRNRLEGRGRRPYAWAHAGVMLACLASLLAGCGGSGAAGDGSGGNARTPAGDYTLTVTASDQGVQRTVSLRLTVN